MRYAHMRVVLTFLGWLSSGGLSALAQDTTLALRNPPSEATATATPPGAAPTPQWLRVQIGLAAGRPTIRMRADPTWVEVHRLQVRVGPAPTPRPPAADVAPPPESGGNVDQALEQALAHAQPAAGRSP
jgi:hypothetical protein